MSLDSSIELVRPIAAPSRGEVKAAAHRTPFRIFGRDVLIMIALAVVAELLLQLVAPQYGHDFYNRTLTASQPVTFNADGYRVVRCRHCIRVRFKGLGSVALRSRWQRRLAKNVSWRWAIRPPSAPAWPLMKHGRCN